MKKTITILTWVLSLALSFFFIYKGLTKHWLGACKVYPTDSEIPMDYINVINAFCHSGFLKMVGFFQILGGLLLIVPKTRLVGAFMLLPVIVSIFSIHFFLDNRPEELVETGIPLVINLIVIGLILKYFRKETIS